MEPRTQVEQAEQPSETPGKRIIPQREPISPVTPVDSRNSIPQIPERSARRSLDGHSDQLRPSPNALQPLDAKPVASGGPSQAPPQNFSFPSRNSTLRETPAAGPPPGSTIPRKTPGSAKTFENLKRAAAGVHVSSPVPAATSYTRLTVIGRW